MASSPGLGPVAPWQLESAEAFLRQAESHRVVGDVAEADAVLNGYRGALANAGLPEPPEVAVSYALNAQVAGDLTEALRRWQAARAQFPFVPIIWATEAAVFRALNRIDEADALTTEGVGRFPDSFDVAVQHCDNAVWRGHWLDADTRLTRLHSMFGDQPEIDTVIAARRRDMVSVLQSGEIAVLQSMAAASEAENLWHAATVLWKAIHARLPEDPAIVLRLAIAMRETGQHEDAENLLRMTMQRFPAEPGLRAAYARLAFARKDWDEAARRWQDAMPLLPPGHDDLLIAAIAFREAGLTRKADKLLEGALAMAPSRVALHANYAMNAERAGNHALATDRWATAHALVAASQQGGADQPEPESDADFMQLARVAEDCHLAMTVADWLDADLAARTMELAFPAYPYVKTTVPRLHAVIAAGLAQMDVHALRALADRADAAKAWMSAAMIWQALRQRVSDSAEPIIGLAMALCQGKQFAEADGVLAEGMKLFPEVSAIRVHHARLPALVQNWAESARRWQVTFRLFQDTGLDRVGAAIAFRESGAHDMAEQILHRAIAAEPERAELYVHGALNAERAGKFPAAVAYWDQAYRLSPDDVGIRNGRGDALWQLEMRRLEREEGADDPGLVRDAANLGQADARELMLAFEGLGDNCEFGIVQRHFGADPIGLFRFGSISVPNLLTMLAEKFARLGEPGFLKLETTDSGEYMVKDTRGFYQMHSFMRQDAVKAEIFLQQQVRRVGFLKRKLLEDMESGEKIFVYKATRGITNGEITALHAALRAQGPNWLLVVTRGPHMSLRVVGDGVLSATLAHLYDSTDSPIDFASWRKILEATLRHRQASCAARLPPGRGAGALTPDLARIPDYETILVYQDGP
jgi:tetratricopeptide (TPR) repeat protein